MKKHLGAVDELMKELARLPGVGRKSAERMAYSLLRGGRDEALALSDAIRRVIETVRPCSVCGNFTESEVCDICSDSRREPSSICVVEMPQDVAHIEKTGAFKGLYHVLMGRLSPLENVGPGEIRIKELLRRIRDGKVREVVLATNPTAEGDATAAYLEKLLKERGVRATRPARGLPVGSAIEYVDSGILGEAMRRRHG